VTAPAEEQVASALSAAYGIEDLITAFQLTENGDYGNAAESAREAARHLDNAHHQSRGGCNG
jgi:cellobiose-specific phosphotransferase system component IIA